MRRAALWLLLASASATAMAREVIDAAPPSALSVTVYRDPDRGPDQRIDRNWPRGFAMISETRQVTLPQGESTIRFDGVAEGMVAVTAIVTGLPGGTIEKNRNAELLSPGALVDGSLGNRVTITRTNPATGAETSEDAIVRTRADGGLVLQTAGGYEAVRCSGLAENVTFDRVPAGLSANPVYSIDTRSPEAGTYTVTLTYLAWGFDWQANYVATLAEPIDGPDLAMHLTSWLTLVNDNGQSFQNAVLMAVAGKLQVVSNFQSLANPPEGSPLQLMCYPFGSTAEGTFEHFLPSAALYPPPAPPPPVAMEAAKTITVTGSRSRAPAMVARQEDLADLKLYRVPEPVTVAAKSQKQVAFLHRERVTGRWLYTSECTPWIDSDNEARPAAVMLATINDREHGLGVALPAGSLTVFEESARGDRMVGARTLRDYASGQEVEIGLGQSTQVFASCAVLNPSFAGGPGERVRMRASVTNANPSPATVRIVLGKGDQARIEGLKGVRTKDGAMIVDVAVPANGKRVVEWTFVE